MSSDRDRPDDDLAEVTPEERARATALARLVDAMLEGQAPPPALEAESRSLLETATAIRAGLGNAELMPDRKRRLVEGALAEGRRVRKDDGGELIAFPRPSTAPPVPVGADVAVATSTAAAVRVPSASPTRRDARGGARLARHAPWAVAALCAAAALVLLVRPPTARPQRAPAPPAAARFAATPTSVLIGAIPHDQAGNARARIDAIYADRLATYRRTHFAGQSPR